MNRCFLVFNLDGFSEKASVAMRFFQKKSFLFPGIRAAPRPELKISFFWAFRLEKCVF
jgi:hypothetical protein